MQAYPRKHLRVFIYLIFLGAFFYMPPSYLPQIKDGMYWRKESHTESNQRLNSSMPVHFYIKTSGIEEYFARAKYLVEKWGQDTDNITLLTDWHNADEVDQFCAQHPFLYIVHVNGTDQQGEYKIEEDGDHDASFLAQRIKTRAVFNEFALLDPKPDWVCYMDDDMMVNITNLKQELSQLWHKCSPDCLIADGLSYEGWLPYTGGGYCIEHDLASRVMTLLHEHTDDELDWKGWKGNDDCGFNMMLKNKLNVTRLGSPLWYCQFSKPSVTSNGINHVSIFEPGYNELKDVGWDYNQSFMESWAPTLSVYNTKYENHH